MTMVESDDRFDRHFNGRLMQVFLYVTDECNIRCTQCYYKPALKKHHAEMPTAALIALLQKFRELGAVKVSFLGGEPTLYGQADGNQPLPFLIRRAREIGFEYVRIVTNGIFDNALLSDARLRDADEITFSMDGDTAEIHNALRGRNAFERSLRNLQAAVSLGYVVHVTMCAHRGNIIRGPDGMPLLSRAIRWATSLGVKSVNVHPLLRMGVARDAWTGDTDIDPKEWMAAYRDIQQAITAGEYAIAVRIPPRFATAADFDEKRKLFGYCSVKLADRIDVHPNGQIHSCALHSGTPIAVSNFEEQNGRLLIKWAEHNNETGCYPFNDKADHPCVVMSRFPDPLRPLCISIKPDQNEFIWNRMHRF